MNIHLTPELEQFISSQKEELRQQIEDSWQAAQRGELVNGDEVFSRIDDELKAMEQSALRPHP